MTFHSRRVTVLDAVVWVRVPAEEFPVLNLGVGVEEYTVDRKNALS